MTLNKLRLQANEKGFTLIELMIVIAIIGILAAIAIPNYISYRDKAFCSAAESDAQAIASGLSDYFAIPSNTSFASVAAGATSIAFPGSATISLSRNNTAAVTQAGAAGALRTYRIAVTDTSQRCPQAYRQGNQKWNGFVYGITL